MSNYAFSVSEEYLQPEVRCGYEISAKMKAVFARNLELLAEFVRVCEKNGLTYFIDGGTLLGAVRHGGFIPWDDDVDVIMPRADYDKLWEIAADEFSYPFFFQTPHSEKRFFRTHAQLRHSETTGYIDEDKDRDVNRGIFLDVFALDALPDDPGERESFRKKIQWEKNLLNYAYDVKWSEVGFAKKIKKLLIKIFFFFVPFRAVFDKFNRKTLGRYKNESTRDVGDLTLEWRECVHWRREWYEGTVTVDFEGMKLSAPSGYDEILKRQYGEDYMRIPRAEDVMAQRSHGNITLDPYKSYKDK